MGIFPRSTPEPDSEAETHVWSIDQIIADKIEDSADASEAVTGIPRVMPDIPTTAEIMALKAAGKPDETLNWHCGGCSATIPLSEFHEKGHKCELSARQAGRKERWLQAQKLTRPAANPTRVCEICDETVPAAGVHQCSPKTTLLPHDQAALAWQQAGAREALKGLLGTEADDGQAS